jgi:hypothetical protein
MLKCYHSVTDGSVSRWSFHTACISRDQGNVAVTDGAFAIDHVEEIELACAIAPGP